MHLNGEGNALIDAAAEARVLHDVLTKAGNDSMLQRTRRINTCLAQACVALASRVGTGTAQVEALIESRVEQIEAEAE